MYLHLLPIWSLFAPVILVGTIAFVVGLVCFGIGRKNFTNIAGLALAAGGVAAIVFTGMATLGGNIAHNTRELQTQSQATYGVHLSPGDANFLLAGYEPTITISSTRSGNMVTDRNQLAKLGHQGDRTTLIVRGPVISVTHPVSENAHELPR